MDKRFLRLLTELRFKSVHSFGLSNPLSPQRHGQIPLGLVIWIDVYCVVLNGKGFHGFFP